MRLTALTIVPPGFPSRRIFAAKFSRRSKLRGKVDWFVDPSRAREGCLGLALFGHRAISELSPLCDQKRTEMRPQNSAVFEIGERFEQLTIVAELPPVCSRRALQGAE